MSTLKVIGLQHPSAVSNNVVLDSSGRVTTPLQPALTATSTTNRTISTTTSLQFDTILANRNNAITASLSNSRFTVPVAGYYVFSMSYFMVSINDSALDLWITGVSKHRFGSNIGGVSGTSSNLGGATSLVLSLAANDYIEIFGSGSKTLVGSGAPHHTYMSLYLLG